MSVLFISDLHLQAERPDISRAFLRFLHERASKAEALYILGDFFEVWVGDDLITAPADGTDTADRAFWRQCATELRAFAQRTPTFFISGNRDFLLGTAGLAACGLIGLNDPTVLVFGGRRWLLSHGDALCLADTDYMAFRTEVRSPAWQQAFLARPLAEREATARHMREVSETSQRAKENPYTDLQPAATEDFLRTHGYATFIHGHTHQPATHDHIVDGIHVERWVLADWHEDRGECLAWDGEALHREILRPVAQ